MDCLFPFATETVLRSRGTDMFWGFWFWKFSNKSFQTFKMWGGVSKDWTYFPQIQDIWVVWRMSDASDIKCFSWVHFAGPTVALFIKLNLLILWNILPKIKTMNMNLEELESVLWLTAPWVPNLFRSVSGNDWTVFVLMLNVAGCDICSYNCLLMCVWLQFPCQQTDTQTHQTVSDCSALSRFRPGSAKTSSGSMFGLLSRTCRARSAQLQSGKYTKGRGMTRVNKLSCVMFPNICLVWDLHS